MNYIMLVLKMVLPGSGLDNLEINFDDYFSKNYLQINISKITKAA